MHHEILRKPWEVVGADIFTSNNRKYLCTVGYHGKFPKIKKTEDLLADSIIVACKIIFSDNGLPIKIMSDIGDNFMSGKFEKFYKKLNI